MIAKKSIKEIIASSNQQLEQCGLREKRGRLYLRSRHFPPKPGDEPGQQYEIAMGVNASPAGIKVALAKAKQIDSDLMWDRFDWKPYLKGPQKIPETVGEWVSRYEADHWEHTPRTATKENSYHKNYRLYYQKMSEGSPLTLELMRGTIVELSKPGSRNRQFYCMSYRKLAEFMGRNGVIAPDELATFKEELKILKQGYEPEPILPEKLPTDDEILAIRERIKNPGWRWLYGMLATYGLRPHEVFRLDLDTFTEKSEALRVWNNTKTGARLTYPCPPSWRSHFRLWEVTLPKIQNIEGRVNNVLTEKVGQKFRELKLPHTPKDLRHAWCIRTALHGVPDSFAAKWAGHSVAVHTKTYHQAISDAQHREVFERMKQMDRDSEE